MQPDTAPDGPPGGNERVAAEPPAAPPCDSAAGPTSDHELEQDLDRGVSWITQDTQIPSSLRLNQLLEGPGSLGSARSTRSSPWSELDFEVERLAQALSQLHCHCDITVVDYCKTRTRFSTDLDNCNLGDFLAKERPPWSKVRWICVDGGVSGDILQVLTRAYDLQPLALEDTTAFQRIKLDAYREHLFLTSYVWDLVDRPRKKDKAMMKRNRQMQRQQLWRQRQQRQRAAANAGAGAGAAAADNHHEARHPEVNTLRARGPVARGAIEMEGGAAGPTGNGAGAGGGGPGPPIKDVEAGNRGPAAPAGGKEGSGGLRGAFGRWLGMRRAASGGARGDGRGPGRRRRARRASHVGWGRSRLRSPDTGEPTAPANGGEGGAKEGAGAREYDSSGATSSGFSGSDESEYTSTSSESDDDASAGYGGGDDAWQPPADTGGRGQRLDPGIERAWRDEDSAQAALEAWQQKLYYQREQVVRQWQEKAEAAAQLPEGRDWRRSDGGSRRGGGGSRHGGGGSRHGCGVHGEVDDLVPLGRDPVSFTGPTGVAALAAPLSSRPLDLHSMPPQEEPRPGASVAFGGCGPAAASWRQEGRDRSGHSASRVAMCCHLGAKHRRKARLRMPLQAPFFAYSTSGRSLGSKRVILEQVSFFVCPDGVLISLFQRTGRSVAGPIMSRLRGMSSLLVDSEDVGVLLQSLIQSTLDYSLPVFEAFASKVAGVDSELVKGKFKMTQSRRLHLLSTDLSLMLRSFSTIQPMLAALHSRCVLPPPEDTDDEEAGGGTDEESLVSSISAAPRSNAAARGASASTAARSAAAAAAPKRRAPAPGSAAGGGGDAGGIGTGLHGKPSAASLAAAGMGGWKVKGDHGILLSELAGMYIADVHDQAVTGEQDLAALLEHTNRLSDLVFNTVSHSNESANMVLAIMGMFFMPLTFVAGVYGMNFDYIPELHWQHGYAYFWLICAALLLASFAFLNYFRIIRPPRHTAWEQARRAFAVVWERARSCCGGRQRRGDKRRKDKKGWER